jgi:hypothetical protein
MGSGLMAAANTTIERSRRSFMLIDIRFNIER